MNVKFIAIFVASIFSSSIIYAQTAITNENGATDSDSMIQEDHEEGHDNGHDEGHEGEHEDGHDEGHEGEHEEGHEDEHEDRHHEDEHEDGHEEGHGDGHDEGHGGEHEDGHEEGHGDGHDEGHESKHEDGHDEEHEGGHDDTESTSLSSSQLTLADIKVETLTKQIVDYELYAPGELHSNGYTSYSVSPRVASVVLRRHVALGDFVKKGQPLVTLYSESVALEQAKYRTVLPEWSRVQSLGRQTVGEQRYINAKASVEATSAVLRAYGLSTADLESSATQSKPRLGEYTLYADIDGAVLTDDFEQGQRIEAGERLVTLADEEQLWVEAHLPADLTLTLGEGTSAKVVAGATQVIGKVSQESHTIDPITHTRTVRLLVDNLEHRLHSGQFADVFFRFKSDEPVLAVSEEALMRGADGDWTIYVEGNPGEFQPVEVILGRALGKLREISGIEPGQKYVKQGAFFVSSQIAKGGFDPHNH